MTATRHQARKQPGAGSAFTTSGWCGQALSLLVVGWLVLGTGLQTFGGGLGRHHHDDGTERLSHVHLHDGPHHHHHGHLHHKEQNEAPRVSETASLSAVTEPESSEQPPEENQPRRTTHSHGPGGHHHSHPHSAPHDSHGSHDSHSVPHSHESAAYHGQVDHAGDRKTDQPPERVLAANSTSTSTQEAAPPAQELAAPHDHLSKGHLTKGHPSKGHPSQRHPGDGHPPEPVQTLGFWEEPATAIELPTTPEPTTLASSRPALTRGAPRTAEWSPWSQPPVRGPPTRALV